jgi:hypothetical protein
MGNEEHNHDEDGCLCDVQISKAELVDDEDLPASFGGIAAVLAGLVGEEIDGCDLDFRKGTTPDDELPASRGGVA